jgi:predicted DCC family thiol-disulfide oxidoreductase YuxK
MRRHRNITKKRNKASLKKNQKGAGNGALFFGTAIPRNAQPDIKLSSVVRKIMAKVIIWYDGTCPLCIREIALMRRLDRRGAIDFLDIAPTDAICPLDRQLMLARFHASEDGIMLSGAAAFAAMWRAIPLLKPLGIIARNTVVLGLLERLYNRFLIIRPRLQKLLD